MWQFNFLQYLGHNLNYILYLLFISKQKYNQQWHSDVTGSAILFSNQLYKSLIKGGRLRTRNVKEWLLD